MGFKIYHYIIKEFLITFLLGINVASHHENSRFESQKSFCAADEYFSADKTTHYLPAAVSVLPAHDVA